MREMLRPEAAAAQGGGAQAAPGGFARLRSALPRSYQHYLDRTTPHRAGRWLGTAAAAAAYALRILYVKGFYLVSYGLGIYILNLFIGFLSPRDDPELDAAALPTRGSDEFRPFVRRLPEFKFWYAVTKAFFVAFVMTFLSMFDVPAFWPILLFYWIVLFVLTMRRQISHMIKYKYIPFDSGKKDFFVFNNGPQIMQVEDRCTQRILKSDHQSHRVYEDIHQ